MATAGPVLRLHRRGKEGTDPVLVRKYPFMIGRSKESNMRVQDAKVSSKHCILDWHADQEDLSVVMLKDLSTYGTYIDGVKAGAAPNKLPHGAELSLTVDYLFVVEYEEQSLPIASALPVGEKTETEPTTTAAPPAKPALSGEQSGSGFLTPWGVKLRKSAPVNAPEQLKDLLGESAEPDNIPQGSLQERLKQALDRQSAHSDAPDASAPPPSTVEDTNTSALLAAMRQSAQQSPDDDRRQTMPGWEQDNRQTMPPWEEQTQARPSHVPSILIGGRDPARAAGLTAPSSSAVTAATPGWAPSRGPSAIQLALQQAAAEQGAGKDESTSGDGASAMESASQSDMSLAASARGAWSDIAGATVSRHVSKQQMGTLNQFAAPAPKSPTQDKRPMSLPHPNAPVEGTWGPRDLGSPGNASRNSAPFVTPEGGVASRYTEQFHVAPAEITALRQRAAQALAERQILRQGTCRRKVKRLMASSWSSAYTLTLTAAQLLLAPNGKRDRGATLDLRHWDVALSEKGPCRFDLVKRGGEAGGSTESLIQLKAASMEECRAWYNALSERCIELQCSMAEETLVQGQQPEEEEEEEEGNGLYGAQASDEQETMDAMQGAFSALKAR